MELIYNKLNEVWTTISINGLEFLNEYKISNYGRVMQYNKLKKINFDGKSLPSYRFCCDYKDMHISAQKLTMMAFSYRPDYKDHSVIVFDGNWFNSYIDNLCWDDYTKYGLNLITYPAFPNIPVDGKEQWIPLCQFGYLSDIDTNGYYVSTYGRIFSNKSNISGKFLYQGTSNDNHMSVKLKDINGNYKQKFVHRIVMSMFNPIPNMEQFEINHIDGNPKNNHIGNLEWCTSKQNVHHAIIHGMNKILGEQSSTLKYSSDIVYKILDLYLSGLQPNEIHKIIKNEVNSDTIANNFTLNIIKGLYRQSEISNYLIGYNYTPSVLLSNDVKNAIIEEAKGNLPHTIICNKYFIRSNTPECLCVNLIISIIRKDSYKWINYIDL